MRSNTMYRANYAVLHNPCHSKSCIKATVAYTLDIFTKAEIICLTLKPHHNTQRLQFGEDMLTTVVIHSKTLKRDLASEQNRCAQTITCFNLKFTLISRVLSFHQCF